METTENTNVNKQTLSERIKASLERGKQMQVRHDQGVRQVTVKSSGPGHKIIVLLDPKDAD